jgi:hypothetical protein
VTQPDPYCSLAQLKDVLGIDSQDDADDAAFAAALEAVSRMIDLYSNRFFYPQNTATRRYTPSSHTMLNVDDVRTVTAVKVDMNDDGVYETTVPAGDVLLEPLNPPLGHPYTRLVLRTGRRGWPTVTAAVEVTGNFGWAAVPPQVQQACLLQTSRLFKRGKDAPFGVLMQPEMESGMRLLNKLDVDVEVLLNPLRRHTPRVG